MFIALISAYAQLKLQLRLGLPVLTPALTKEEVRAGYWRGGGGGGGGGEGGSHYKGGHKKKGGALQSFLALVFMSFSRSMCSGVLSHPLPFIIPPKYCMQYKKTNNNTAEQR